MTDRVTHFGESTGLTLRDFALTLDGREFFALDLQVVPGEVATLMGPSGIGKSSLLAVIAGIHPAPIGWQGDILFDGQDITRQPPHTRRIGLLRQDALLFPHLSVGANLAFAIPREVRSSSERRALVACALSQAGMENFEDRDPATLSGGQRARVALLRTLLSAPRLLLLDEPFANLDATLRTQFREYIVATAIDRNLPVLLVTHDQDDAAAMRGPIVTVSNHSGDQTHV